MLKAIVAVDNNWAIGKDNQLLAHLPGDLAYFKEKTLGKIIVMGRQTLESFPGGKPLPGRKNIVLTRNDCYEAQCQICCSLEELFESLDGDDPDNVFIVGGEQIYRSFLPFCDEVFVTKIDAELPADRFFPNLDKDDDWLLADESDSLFENGLTYKFCTYRRKAENE